MINKLQHIAIAVIVSLTFAKPASAQCTFDIDDSSMMSIPLTYLHQNTTIFDAVHQDYVICPGVTATYTGTQSVFCNFYMEPGSQLELRTYFYPSVFMKNSTLLDCGASQPLSPMMIPVVRDPNAIIIDSAGLYVSINECPIVTFNYPGGIFGCIQTWVENPDLINDKISVSLISSELTVIIPGDPGTGSFTITDINGRQVFSGSFHKSSALKTGTGNLKNGVYFVKVILENGKVYSEKVAIIQ
jgi:hypothetical protein